MKLDEHQIVIENLTFAYNGLPAVESLGLAIRAGEVLSLVGPNGSGKTTLLKLISGFLKAKMGAIYLDGAELTALKPYELAQKLSALEQEHHVGFDFTVREIVEWGRTAHRGRLGPWRDGDEQAVTRALELTELGSLAARPISKLSGGERQRVFLAMALAQQPRVLLLDEPTAHLDLRFQREILNIIKKLAQSGITVIAAIHDLSLAARVSNRVAILSRGCLVQVGPPADVLTPAVINAVWGVETEIINDGTGIWVLPKS